MHISNNASCLWLIVIILVLLCCCGNNPAASQSDHPCGDSCCTC